MNDRNYKNNPEGLRHIRTLIEERKTVMMASELDSIPFSICPMTLQQMDDKGDLWFFVAKDSGLFQDIEKDNRVQIIYTDNQKHTYISIFGNATHMISKEKKDELWNSNLLNWFDGKDDSNLALISVNMENAFYWDNENAKLVSLFKIVEGGSVKRESGEGVKGFVDL